MPGISVRWQVGSSIGMTIAVLSSPEVYKHLLALCMLAKREEVLISPKRVISSTLPTLSRSSENHGSGSKSNGQIHRKIQTAVKCSQFGYTMPSTHKFTTAKVTYMRPGQDETCQNPNVNRVGLLQASPLNVELLGVYSFCGEKELLVF